MKPRPPVTAWIRRHRFARYAQRGVWPLLIVAMLAYQAAARKAAWEDSDRIHARVLEIQPNDTLRVERLDDGSTAPVRLIGVTLTATGPAWLAAHALHQPVTLTFDSNTRRDSAGVLLVYLYLPDGRLVNESAIEVGAARFDPVTRHILANWLARTQARIDRKLEP